MSKYLDEIINNEYLNEFTYDENNMIILEKNNAIIAEQQIIKTSKYDPKDKKLFFELINLKDDDPSEDKERKAKTLTANQFFEIIKKINTVNKTRLSSEKCEVLANYIFNNKNSFFNDLKNNNTNIIDIIVEYMKTRFPSKNPNPTGPISLVSKVCVGFAQWIYGINNTKFTKYDSVIKEVLHYYLGYYHININYYISLYDKDNLYTNFHNAIEKVKEMIDPKLSYNDLDHILWFIYRNFIL